MQVPRSGKMDNSFETDGNGQFADRQNSRDLRVQLDESWDTAVDHNGILEGVVSSDGLKAFKQGHDGDSQVKLNDELKPRKSTPGGGPRRKFVTRRVLVAALLVLAVAAIAPSVWNYLRSYESTD